MPLALQGWRPRGATGLWLPGIRSCPLPWLGDGGLCRSLRCGVLPPPRISPRALQEEAFNLPQPLREVPQQGISQVSIHGGQGVRFRAVAASTSSHGALVPGGAYRSSFSHRCRWGGGGGCLSGHCSLNGLLRSAFRPLFFGVPRPEHDFGARPDPLRVGRILVLGADPPLQQERAGAVHPVAALEGGPAGIPSIRARQGLCTKRSACVKDATRMTVRAHRYASLNAPGPEDPLSDCLSSAGGASRSAASRTRIDRFAIAPFSEHTAHYT